MSTAELIKPLTTADLLAFPDDGINRWLIRGELREQPKTLHGRRHAMTMTCLVSRLGDWKQTLHAGGWLMGGDVGCILSRDPDSTVGIDIAYFGQEVVDQQDNRAALVDGAPILAVEIQSPSDTVRNVDEKTGVYLDAGVKLVWNIDPHSKTITVVGQERLPVLYNVTQTITGEPWLPGLSIAVKDVFPY
jgi:Uma2 family endonuclease